MLTLTIFNLGGQALKTYDLARVESAHQRVLIGRADDCDIRIAHGAVSRHHCAIEPLEDDPDEWVIRDLGSTHGLTVDGERVREAAVHAGLEVRVGPAVLKFESAAAKIAEAIRSELGEG
ncbi:MAG: FHA domain-containing protein [Phycisphaeraceae bacterium]|nr:FHA domain-containing protein [Phycisphaeraceae bacterium]